MNLKTELETARRAAELAGREIMILYEEFEEISDAPADISTVADHHSQEVILETISSAFPADAFCAEEETFALKSLNRSGPRLWVIDPIDGSRGFARKNGEFSVMIGLVIGGKPILGVVLEPAARKITWAVAGNGCQQEVDGGPARVCRISSTSLLMDATLVRSHSERNRHHADADRAKRHIYTYSAGIKLALVAGAEADMYVSDYRGFRAWDICAGQILVEEAGGIVCDLTGQRITYPDNGEMRINGIIASNGPLRQIALSYYRNSE